MNEKSIGTEKTVAVPGVRSEASFPPGYVLGQYRLIRLLGRGGMGEVYEAEHSTLGLRYALKLLPLDFASRSGALKRFRKEARVMAQLQHPNIVKVDEFGETGGRYWLRMELMSGVGEGVISLADLAKRGGGKVGQKELLSILKQMVNGLGYAHSRGAVHRDLKPGNILLEKGPDDGILAKVSDFGLVRLVGEEWVRSQAQVSVQRNLSLGEQATEAAGGGTSTKALLGTYEYMSPEQKRGEEADARSDIYSLGLIAYRLLTGKSLGMRTPSQIDPGLDPAWDRLVSGALEEARDERLSNCMEFNEFLSAIMRDTVLTEDGEKQESENGQQGTEIPTKTTTAVKREPLKLDLGNRVLMDMVWIPPGSFLMGSASDEHNSLIDEKPQRRVEISRGFWIGKFAVTQDQYEQVAGVNPSHFKGANLPVDTVSWYDAKKFCDRMNILRPAGMPTGCSFHLPTEAQWEYACRAGSTSDYFFGNNGDDLKEYSWFSDTSGGQTRPVGLKRPNSWGLYDMCGNVWEWCNDWYSANYYAQMRPKDPSGPVSGRAKVARGGSWGRDSFDLRSAFRFFRDPTNAYNSLGFRVVLAEDNGYFHNKK